jgi:nucleoside-diphosphate-sugar epimerase
MLRTSQMQRVVVTGGLGFIGSHVVDGLLEAGRDVTIIDSMVAAVTDGSEFEEQGCAVHRRSVADYFADGGDFGGVDLVVHAASPVGPASILRDQGQLGVEIVTTTQLVVDACLEGEVALCAFSSAEVYGRSGRLRERDSVIVPTRYNARLEYAVAKVLTEAITVNTRHQGLRGLVIRPFNVAGPRQSRAGGFVMPTFVQQALEGRPLTVFAGGEQVRAFLSATDLSRFITDHLEAAFESEEPIFNLGNPDNATTVWNLAERVVELLDSSSGIEHADGRLVHGPLYEEAESFEKVPVLDAAAAAGWLPRITLDELIAETAGFYRRHEDPRTANAAPLDAGARV